MNLIKKYKYSMLISMIIVITSLIFFNATSDSCTYVINGKVKVESQFPEFLAEKIVLSDLPVKVHGKSCYYPCIWSEWGETRTDSRGFFEIKESKSGNACDGRYIKAEVQFNNDDVRLRTNQFNSSNWYKIGYRTKSQCTGYNDCEFGDLLFYKSGNYDRNDDDARAHADLWWILKWVVDFFDGTYKIKPDGDPLDVIYPLNSLIVPDSVEASYVSPSTKLVHLYADNEFDSLIRIEKTIFHELGHVWAFNHSQNESLMRNYLLTHLSTHGVVKKSAVAFHEGFATWFGNNLYVQLLEDMDIDSVVDDDDNLENFPYYNLPFAKSDLSGEHYNSRDKYQGNVKGYGTECKHHGDGSLECYDDGWFSLLKGLTMGARKDIFINENKTDIVSYDTLIEDESSRYIKPRYSNYDWSCHIDRPEVDFFDILDVFYSDSIFDQIHTDDMNFEDFLYRFRKKQNIDSNIINKYIDVWDLDSEDQPHMIFCENSLIITDIDAGTESYWSYDYSSKSTVKTVSVTVSNFSEDTTPLMTYLKGPNEFTGNLSFANQISLSSLEEKTFDFTLTVPSESNGTFPATTMTWKTLIFNNDDWITDNDSITFGSDYQADAYIVSRSESIGYELDFKSVLLPGKTLSDSVLTSRFVDMKPSGLKNLLSDDEDLAFFDPSQTFNVYCGAVNIGNVSPSLIQDIDTTIGIYINDELYDYAEINKVNVGYSKYVLFTVRYNAFDSYINHVGFNSGFSIKCKVDIEEEIIEISEANNEITVELISAYSNDILPSFNDEKEKEFSNIKKIVWEKINDIDDIKIILDEVLEYDEPHQYFYRLNNLEIIINQIIENNYKNQLYSGKVLSDTWTEDQLSIIDIVRSRRLISDYLKGDLPAEKLEQLLKF